MLAALRIDIAEDTPQRLSVAGIRSAATLVGGEREAA